MHLHVPKMPPLLPFVAWKDHQVEGINENQKFKHNAWKMHPIMVWQTEKYKYSYYVDNERRSI